MKITTNLLKQIIREQLLKEASREDLDFLRDVRYSGVDPESYMRIVTIYQIAAKNDDIVTMDYINSIPGIPRHAHGRYFRTHEVNLVKRFLDEVDFEEEDGFMDSGTLGKDDFANFIRRDGQVGQKRFAMAALLWPLVHFVHNETKADRHRGGPSYDLED